MAIIFRYARVQRDDAALSRAPFIPVFAHAADGRRICTPALVDSGADGTVLPLRLAEMLGVTLGEETETGGIGGFVKARKASLALTLRGGRESYNLRIPALVMLDSRMNIPLILGRNGFFERFGITFRQREEKLVLKAAA